MLYITQKLILHCDNTAQPLLLFFNFTVVRINIHLNFKTMKYLNKNIETLGKKEAGKTLINSSTSGGVILNCDFDSPKMKDYLQNVKKSL